ncbi:FtsX-like permease family protein [Clostridium bowmanii]|uniref:ABC transporter permease n=1 Tax=Clostridium bowmanii TaxID=132925 RepID=UPI001C0E63A1|nr:FtsX-like permease family protein [Clostridium bowmanii]MBU3190507.1 FtsX-like permease family protein [Clostridium bowmanii]MCA1074431.1 FtsX-like permease family protein [Clostridium bowmanii]
MKLPFKIAVRFLKSSKGQTILIATGIAIGVSVQIFIGSLIQGLQKSLIDKTIGNSSQITITSNKDDKTIENWSEKIAKIKVVDSRIKKISAAADSPAFIKYSDKTAPILIRGLNLEPDMDLYNIKSKIYKGKAPQNLYEVLVGKNLQEELKLSIGDKISLITPNGKTKESVVTGFYDLKVAGINKSWIITSLETSQDIFGFSNKITSIEMQVSSKDVFKADAIAIIVKEKLADNNLKVENWKAQNEELLGGLNGQSVSSLMIQVFVLISVTLGIASVLAVTVVQKSKQIGILKAMGIKDRDASKIFLYEGLLLGIAGALLGIIFGITLMVVFTKFAVNPDGTSIIPLYLDYKFIAISGSIAVLSASIAALIPARSSSKLEPIEVIKNG